MPEVITYEAKAHLLHLLERVAKGERITITRHGVPVAVLMPLALGKRRSVVETIAAVRAFRQGRRLDGVALKSLIEEGRG